MTPRGIATVAVVSACLLPLAGCGKKAVPEKTVESEVAKQLAEDVNQATPAVKCPGDLTAKVGTKMICTLTPQDSTTTYPVTVTVTSVANGVAHFSAEVGNANPG
ncbi:MAG: DUF4333 domain-containing protein [Frankiaceae bacterium]|nr:DUF4333 domain-containing protein [Frankiaceae bacterium]MBV9869269.1 DUF4333 domain-containing protein [Frankiaceae bacterium]